MQTFVVERYLPGQGEQQLMWLVDRLTCAEFGPEVHYRGTIVVPGDEACMCLFDAEAAETVKSANLALGLPVARVVAATVVTAQSSGGDPGGAGPSGPEHTGDAVGQHEVASGSLG